MVRRLIFGLVFMLVNGAAIASKETSLLPIPELTEEGLHRQPWFETTFLDLRQDLSEANTQGKRLVILWEQRDCSYCTAIHVTNLRIPKIVNYIKSNFFVLQLNLWGSVKVTDFDGEILSEKDLARKHQIRFTPTIQFFPGAPENVGSISPGRKVEAMQIPGYFKPFEFYYLFHYINEEGYEQEPSFQAWLNTRIDGLQTRY